VPSPTFGISPVKGALMPILMTVSLLQNADEENIMVIAMTAARQQIILFNVSSCSLMLLTFYDLLRQMPYYPGNISGMHMCCRYFYKR
jgi:hypothetical protein